MGDHVRVSCRLYEAEDPELFVALTALDVEDRSRRARALMRLGFMAERAAAVYSIMPKSVGLPTAVAATPDPVPVLPPVQEVPGDAPSLPDPADFLMELGLDVTEFALT